MKAIHPAAELFPLMTAAELKALADDIKAHGLIEPILLHEGQVLDGRHRQQACEMAGIEPRYAEADINGHSPTLFVVSKNLHRRQLSVAQRAAVGAKLMPFLKAEGLARKRTAASIGGHIAGGGRPKSSLVANLPKGYSADTAEIKGHHISRSIAAQAVGVSPRTIQDATAVMARSPELFKQIESGELSPAAAYDAVKGRPLRKHSQPPRPSASATKTPQYSDAYLRRRGNAARDLMVEGLSKVRGTCRGLLQMDVTFLVKTLNADERKTWKNMAKECARCLNEFSRRLSQEKQGQNENVHPEVKSN